MASARISLLRSIGCMLLLLAGAASAQAQYYGDGFDPNADANVYAMVRQPDGKIVVGGSFSYFEPDRYGNLVSRQRIARIERDGSIDPTFTTTTEGDISAMALQPDGKIVIAGKFAWVEGPNGRFARSGLARINPDGTVDTGFAQINPVGVGEPPYQNYPQAIIRAVAVQSDGRIIIGGAFISLQPEVDVDNDPATPFPIHARSRIARLNTNGSVDTTFDVAANNTVLALLVEPDGDIMIGGGFTTLRGTGGTAATRHRVARVKSDGTLDPGFTARLDNRVLTFGLQADGKVLVGGEFTTVTLDSETPRDAGSLMRFNADGTVDTTFEPYANSSVETIAIQADGRLLVGGRFQWIRKNPSAVAAGFGYITRMFMDGTVDSSFFPNANAPVTSLLVQPDGTIMVAGYLTGIGSGSGAFAQRGRIARLQADGTVDVAFRTTSSGTVTAVEEEPGGSFLVAGTFSSLGGVTRYALARVNADGSISTTFRPDFDGGVNVVRRLSDGSILVGGGFTRVNNEEQIYIARFRPDGTLDTTFDPRPSAAVYDITTQADGKILIGGNFINLQPDPNADAVIRRYIARLNTNGTVDTTFDPSPNLTVSTIIALSDGRVLFSGDFTQLQPNGARRAEAYFYIARVNADGTPDESFMPRPSAAIAGMEVEPSGKILISGNFTQFLPNKDTTPTTRYYVARLNDDGSLDSTFEAKPNAAVHNIERFSDGRYLIHGAFTMFRQGDTAETETWVDQPYLAWLMPDGKLDTTRKLTPDAVPSMTKVLASGNVLVGGNMSRFTGINATQVTLVNDPLVRILPAGTVDPTFALSPGAASLGAVHALAPQVGGRLYAGGSFSRLGGSANQGIARLFPDGIVDNSFNSVANGPVRAVLALETSEDEEEAGGPLAWLEPDGSYRSSFSRSGAATFTGSVYTVAVQSDGRVLVGGEFADTAGSTTGNLARLNADGTPDTTFTPEPNGTVQTLAVLNDGRIIVGGSFTNIKGTDHARLARLNADGSLDTTWAPTPDNTVLYAVPLSDGSLLVGGLFTSFKPNGATTAVARAYAARIKADGTVDTDFNPELNGAVSRILVQSDGKILLAGNFTSVKGRAREYLARVDNRGALDTGFYPKPNAVVDRMALTASGGLVVAGRFSNFEPNDAGTTVTRSLVARLNADGTVENGFHPIPNNLVQEVAVRSDGGIMLVGSFTAFQLEQGGAIVRRNRIARFNADGSLDALFNPNANSVVYTLNLRSDSSLIIGGAFDQLRPSAAVLVGGEFTEISEAPTRHLARLNDDGSIDAFYSPQPDGAVHAIAEQSDGSVLVGGAFRTIAGLDRTYLARLDAAGSPDPAFAPTITGTSVTAIAVQPDDRVIIGGEFTEVAGAARTRVARLLSSGAIDSAFFPSTDATVSAIAVQRNGAILLAGAFTQVNGTGRAYLARLAADGTLDAGFAPVIDGAVHTVAVQADGRILIGGAFTHVGGVARAHVARLLADGTLDTSVTLGAGADVHALLIMSDGRVVAGGAFNAFGGRRQLLLARFGNPTPAVHTASLSSDFTTFTWLATGSSPLFSSVEVATSEDGQSWTNAGNAVRNSSGSWQFTGLTGLASGEFNYIRTRAVHPAGGSGSAGRFERAWAFYGTELVGPATQLNSGGALAGWSSAYWTDPSSGNGGSGGTGGGTGGGSGGGSGGSGGGGGGTGGGTVTTPVSYHLVNMSVRAWPQDGQPFIAGLVISGADEGKVLLRGVGPGLEQFGVAPLMSAPRLTIYDRTGQPLSTSAAWSGNAAVAETAEAVGAFPLEPTSADSAVVRTLPPGVYTMHVDAGTGLNGIALGEVYFASESGGLANFSARAPAGAGTAACIAGFVLGGDQPRRLLVRGVGPALRSFGVTDAVPDTTLVLFNAKGEAIASNDNWYQQTGSTAIEVASAAASVGAFALSPNGLDAAITVELPPGAYTVHVGGAVAGSVLAEIYEIP